MKRKRILRDQLWAVFKLLEMANVEAVHTIRQAALIANSDARTAGEVDLVPCRFRIDGYKYGALMTAEQKDLIQQEIYKGGTAKDVLKLIAYDLLSDHLYAAETIVTNILIAALKNQNLMGAGLKQAAGPGVHPVGACKFSDGTCQENCGSALCTTLGGTPCATCPAAAPPPVP
jgi:hypothetical protein